VGQSLDSSMRADRSSNYSKDFFVRPRVFVKENHLKFIDIFSKCDQIKITQSEYIQELLLLVFYQPIG